MSRSTLFRSEEMSLVQLFIPTEIAHSTVSHLGEMGLVHFLDLNSDRGSFRRPYSDEICRLIAVERQLEKLHHQSVALDIEIPLKYMDKSKLCVTARDVDDLRELLCDHESRITNLNQSYQALLQQYQELIEHKHVLEYFADLHMHTPLASPIHPNAPGISDLETGKSGLDLRSTTLGFVAGTIWSSKVNPLEMVLWRALRGNMYMHYTEISRCSTQWEKSCQPRKSVFVIFAHGKEILNKIRRISEAMDATLCPIDHSHAQRHLRISEINSKLSDIQEILHSTGQAKRLELEAVAKNLAFWMDLITKEKAIYHVMNLFNYDPSHKCLIAEGWCPSDDILLIQDSLREAVERTGSQIYTILTPIPTKRQPPTFHRTNKFSEGFQGIIDAYGVAKYREVNPGLFTVITFPFLFSVMFGDMGHGLLLAVFGLYLISKEQSFEGGGVLGILHNGRYIILLMGLFSIFTGSIYNDVFSHSVTILPSGWAWSASSSEATSIGVCPFGLDSAWHGSDNYLIFTNSYKMKMSVILGVLHMSFGIVLTIYNHVHFRHSYEIVAEFLPQILFMECVFGYLCICIIYKWLVDWKNRPVSPPSLLNLLIHMFLSPGSVDSSEMLYYGQEKVQLGLVVLAVVCVPWMLLAKPLILRYRHNRKRESSDFAFSRDSKDIMPEYPDTPGESDQHSRERKSKKTNSLYSIQVATEDVEVEEFEFGEIMIHQVIHTMEFCLGCISNTASYLRLWALSLAHAQLSSVLWDFTLGIVLSQPFPVNTIGIWIGFAIWLALTVSILVIMEGLSAFLHALRLHWVEFNHKFYEGTGYKYTPFNFEGILGRNGSE
ncbi:V0/A0 complex, 116-kDa subunit of ATPase [Basidiobolus meristosporus CBS 931.73]|uniref:V-type proton ATPase subunit a n=1 Tax=Basidiobolus meristosporus CBS 931.73 TaxID=1314790 RepID=A0A1Y1WTS6_9FUNG|nr:V0/A0 complex, 116-kDa subunit of ATPase [Basidiobolus meristosporus CBS 931.73]|eukprot:ORX76949.1 V0/A0 complex, 116-kDa subunit of ATPase [Basidiobolus meristosporus CBS 931.73]